MKRKIFAVIILVLVLTGIAYVRALFSHQDRRPGFSREVTQALPADMLDDYLRKEEAGRSLDSLKRFYEDSLARLSRLALSVVDSLPVANADSLDELICSLEEKLDSTRYELDGAQRNKAAQFEKLVAAFYEGEVSRLPADLSQYEREVSINEIKDKAQKYFGVSADSLDRIIKEYP